MKERGRGGNIRISHNSSQYHGREVVRQRSSDEERESIKLGRRRKKNGRDKEMMTSQKKTQNISNKETQTEETQSKGQSSQNQVILGFYILLL